MKRIMSKIKFHPQILTQNKNLYWWSLYLCVYRHTYHIIGWKHNEKAEQIHILQELNMTYHQSYQTDTGLSLWNNVTTMAQHSPAPLKALRFLCLVCQYFPIQTKYICKQIKIDFEQIWNGIRKSTPQFTQQLCSKDICKGWTKINLNTNFPSSLCFMPSTLCTVGWAGNVETILDHIGTRTLTQLVTVLTVLSWLSIRASH
jgi:hypothetical protein